MCLCACVCVRVVCARAHVVNPCKAAETGSGKTGVRALLVTSSTHTMPYLEGILPSNHSNRPRDSSRQTAGEKHKTSGVIQ